MPAPHEHRLTSRGTISVEGLVLRPFGEADWPAVARIQTAGIATGRASFETEVPTYEKWCSTHLPKLRIVAEIEGQLAGWAAASPGSARCSCVGVAEVSVYVEPALQGRGVGRLLLEALVRASEEEGIWTLQAGVFPDNAASLSLHAACGFSVVGWRERLGRLAGVWRDVVLLERRSDLF